MKKKNDEILSKQKRKIPISLFRQFAYAEFIKFIFFIYSEKNNIHLLQVPKRFLDDTSTQYYVGVSLVTVFHDKSNCRYIHPYELKDINTTGYNDRLNNTVWYPIASHDLHGILWYLKQLLRKS